VSAHRSGSSGGRVIVLGGTSEIALATVRELQGRAPREVALLGRDADALARAASTLQAAGCGLRDLVSATRFLTDVSEQDDLNRVWAEYLDGHLPTTTTVEVSRLATHPRCKIEISAIAVADSSCMQVRSSGFLLSP